MGCPLVGSSLAVTFIIFASTLIVHAENRVIPGEYIVKMKPQNGNSANSSLTTGLHVVGKMGGAISVKQAFWGSTMMHVKSTSAASIESLRAHPDVEFVEPNYLLSIDPTSVQPFGVPASPTDTYSQSNSNVQVTQAWSIEKPSNQGAKVVVAVVDTGLDTTHNLFKDSNGIWVNLAEKNGLAGVDDDGNGYIDDINGWNFVAGNANVFDDENHGTHVAGIILGVGQDILQTPVRESKIVIMPLKFLDSTGSGSTASAISAIYYAVNMGAKVINNSWGGSSYSRSLQDAYAYAHTRGVFIATAAGNSGTNNDTAPIYPAALDTPNNMAVAASTDSDLLASFSNFGNTVQVASPGLSIVSSVPGTGCPLPGCFQIMSGTSMASPFVAGLAALVLRESPQLSGYQVKNLLMQNVNMFASYSGKVSTSGRVNALKTIQAAISSVNISSYNPAYTPVYKADRSVASASSTSSSPAGCGLVKAGALLGGGSRFSGDDSSSGGGGASGGNVAVVLMMIFLPLALALSLRQKNKQGVATLESRRQYARYNLTKELVLKIGDQVVSCASDSLSLGGLSFSAAFEINKGSKIKVKIADLDHEVDGEVVWCSQKQSYGVKFLNVSEQLRANFLMWTAGLSPT